MSPVRSESRSSTVEFSRFESREHTISFEKLDDQQLQSISPSAVAVFVDCRLLLGFCLDSPTLT